MESQALNQHFLSGGKKDIKMSSGGGASAGPAEIKLENDDDDDGVEEEETRDVTTRETTKVLRVGTGDDLLGPQMNNYLFNNSNTTTNLFEMGSSSLLVE